MNNLQIFNNPEFGKIRTIQKDGEPWFVGKDVATALGYSNAKDALAKHIAEEDKMILQRSEIATLENHIPKSALPVNFVSGDVPNRGLTIINESGLYCLIFSSKLEKAKRFKSWVTHEVLPSIRKTGGYQMNKLPPEVSPLALSKLINSTRRVMLDMGCSALEIGAMVQSIFTSWSIPVPYTLAKNIPEQLSIYDMPTLQGS